MCNWEVLHKNMDFLPGWVHIPGGNAERGLPHWGSVCDSAGGHRPHHPVTTYDHRTDPCHLSGPLALEFASHGTRTPEVEKTDQEPRTQGGSISMFR